jgi:DNA modification methylase
MDTNVIYLGDCIDIMRGYPDKSIDLVLTDPPYGINIRDGHRHKFEAKTWDVAPPTQDYFDEIFRVSKNQIIWGGNYFGLPRSNCCLIWDKEQPEGMSLAMAEIAWTSFKPPTQLYRLRAVGATKNRVHMTQKPLALIQWCLKKYAKAGEIILDPFMGSGTTCVAAYQLGMKYIGIDLDADHFADASSRIDACKSQTNGWW